ncbi:hypothetical protein [Chryseosolibacter indicus]|uniref:Uncharacterized protein n=1 Tax=Chryseosolibacter indicus TaxID=2782351 RepID=A0ABS5VQD0_9BACT|nr:hypothetical protein [Chryseosolibacter indicus]MBT1703064.1 hypothetical protein [Chryseosolibacter indicus]
MKYIDVVGQTLILLACIGIGLISIGDNDWPFGAVIFLQLFIGIWQMLSSIISVSFRTNQWKRKRTHLIAAITYLILLYVVTSFIHIVSPTNVLLFLPSWALAVYYYVVSWRCVFIAKKDSNRFLPHISF